MAAESVINKWQQIKMLPQVPIIPSIQIPSPIAPVSLQNYPHLQGDIHDYPPFRQGCVIIYWEDKDNCMITIAAVNCELHLSLCVCVGLLSSCHISCCLPLSSSTLIDCAQLQMAAILSWKGCGLDIFLKKDRTMVSL